MAVELIIFNEKLNNCLIHLITINQFILILTYFSVKAGGMRIVQHKNTFADKDKNGATAAAADEANSVLKVSTR